MRALIQQILIYLVKPVFDHVCFFDHDSNMRTTNASVCLCSPRYLLLHAFSVLLHGFTHGSRGFVMLLSPVNRTVF